MVAAARPARSRRRLVVIGIIAGLTGLTCATCSTTPPGRRGAPRSLVTDGPLSGITLVPAFPNLSFERPCYLTWAPDGEDRVFVLEQRGVIRVFQNDPDVEVEDADTFLDIADRVSRRGNEEGLLGLAFAPDFAQSGVFYVYYSARAGALPLVGGRSVLARFRVGDDGLGDPGSEERIAAWDQPYRNHNGGHIEFGPDGMLYVALGDGGLWGDPKDNAQDRSTHLGAILRIDPSRREGDRSYAIPPDNPFVDDPEAAGEVWAYGLRNVWRFSFDRATGEMFAADVGQDAWEEVNLIVRGGNYGWPAWEAFTVYESADLPRAADAIPPLAAYPHDDGVSVTGGHVYRGAAVPDLNGAYIYADFQAGTVWALRRAKGFSPPVPGSMPSPDAGGTPRRTSPGVTVERLIDGKLLIASFGEDRDGELYVCAFDGKIYRFGFDRRPGGGASSAPAEHPKLLSETGLFDSIASMTPVARAIGYEVNVPLWSDGAGKGRFIVLPPGGRMGYRDEGAWELPVGTRLVKSFFLETVRGVPASQRRLETRVIRREADGWTAVTYVWNEAGDEAALLDGSAVVGYTVAEPDGSTSEVAWYFPSQADCRACHTTAAGFVLGVRTLQWNHRRTGPDGKILEQLDDAAARRLFDGDVPSAAEAPHHPSIGDEDAAVGERARAYLAANCAFCHRPGAPGNASIDLRPELPLEETRLVLEPPGQGDLGLGPDALLLIPGVPEMSILVQRMRHRGSKRAMPPLATAVPDADAVALVEEWIRSMETD